MYITCFNIQSNGSSSHVYSIMEHGGIIMNEAYIELY